jgi:hypothetical protein
VYTNSYGPTVSGAISYIIMLLLKEKESYFKGVFDRLLFKGRMEKVVFLKRAEKLINVGEKCWLSFAF